jgi:hypothetical protein
MIKCVPIQRITYGFAHVCDVCGTIGPIRGEYTSIVDLSETLLKCTFAADCSARAVGWSTSEGEDVCPTCRTNRVAPGRAP